MRAEERGYDSCCYLWYRDIRYLSEADYVIDRFNELPAVLDIISSNSYNSNSNFLV